MSYTPPNIFTATTTMEAAKVDQNNAELRTYLNVGIIAADIPNNIVNTIDIVRGEFVGVVTDHQFTSGDMYTQFIDLLRTNEKYWTAHIKPYDMSADSPYQLLANSGKRIVLEHAADVIFNVGMMSIGNQNVVMSQERRRNPCYVGHTEGDVKLNTDIEACTRGHCYTEDNPYSDLGGDITMDIDDSGNTSSGGSSPTSPGSTGFYSRRWYCQRIGFKDLPAGVHHFYVAMSARCDKGHVKVLNSQIEVFYKNIIVNPG